MNTFTLSYAAVNIADPENGGTKLISEYQIGTWITAVVSRLVQKIKLSLDSFFSGVDFQLVILSPYIFNCKTLVDLTLKYCKLPMPFPSIICLPNLKTFYLHLVLYNSEETLSHLISSYPELEELEINGIWEEDDLLCCSISSPTIKWLKVSFSFDCPETNNHYYRLEINGPALRYLEVEDSLSEHISTVALASLIQADISLLFYEEYITPKDIVAYSGCVLEFLDSLCNVKGLTLTIDHNKFIDSVFTASPVRFHNLTKLELEADWRFILKFLQSADSLKVLIIRQLGKYLKSWMEPEQVPTCLISHLKTMRVHKFGLAENEFEMIRYFLRNAQILKKIEIYPCSDVSDLEKKFWSQENFTI